MFIHWFDFLFPPAPRVFYLVIDVKTNNFSLKSIGSNTFRKVWQDGSLFCYEVCIYDCLWFSVLNTIGRRVVCDIYLCKEPHIDSMDNILVYWGVSNPIGIEIIKYYK